MDCGEGQQVGPGVEVLDLGVDRKDGRVSCFQSYPTFGGSSSSARRGCEKAAVPAFPSTLLLPEETTFQTRRGLLAWTPVCTITAPIVSLSLPALNIIGGCLNWERGGCTVPYSHTPFIRLQPIQMILASFSLDWSSVFILSFRHIHGIQKISAHQFYHVFFFGGGRLAYSLRRGLFKKMKYLICPKREGDLDN